MEDENMPCDHVKAGKKCMPKCNPGFKVGLATIGSIAQFTDINSNYNTDKFLSYIEAVEYYEKQHQQNVIVLKEVCVASVVYQCAFVIHTIFIKSNCTNSLRIKKHSLDLLAEFVVKGSKLIPEVGFFHLLEQHKYAFNVSIAP